MSRDLRHMRARLVGAALVGAAFLGACSDSTIVHRYHQPACSRTRSTWARRAPMKPNWRSTPWAAPTMRSPCRSAARRRTATCCASGGPLRHRFIHHRHRRRRHPRQRHVHLRPAGLQLHRLARRHRRAHRRHQHQRSRSGAELRVPARRTTISSGSTPRPMPSTPGRPRATARAPSRPRRRSSA